MIKTLDPELLHVVVRKFKTYKEADQILEPVLNGEENPRLDHEVHRATILEQEQYKELLVNNN